MSNARPADPLGYTAAHEWRPSFVTPPASGPYERSSAIGSAIDYWDGQVWRRATRSPRTQGWYGGVVCANQDLPWRVGT